jgi:hypothetical protein
MQMKMEHILLRNLPTRLHYIQTLATGRFADGPTDFNRGLEDTSRLPIR